MQVLTFPAKSLKDPSEKIDVDAFQVEGIGDKLKSDLKNLIHEMDHTVRKHGALGLAAPQVGVNKRVIIVKQQPSGGIITPSLNASPNSLNYTAMINPEIVPLNNNGGGEGVPMRRMEEGCLSFPKAFAWVSRPAVVKVRWFDIYSMSYREDMFRDLDASVVQHELDHLDGILLPDRIGPLKSMFTQKYFKANRK